MAIYEYIENFDGGLPGELMTAENSIFDWFENNPFKFFAGQVGSVDVIPDGVDFGRANVKLPPREFTPADLRQAFALYAWSLAPSDIGSYEDFESALVDSFGSPEAALEYFNTYITPSYYYRLLEAGGRFRFNEARTQTQETLWEFNFTNQFIYIGVGGFSQPTIYFWSEAGTPIPPGAVYDTAWSRSDEITELTLVGSGVTKRSSTTTPRTMIGIAAGHAAWGHSVTPMEWEHFRVVYETYEATPEPEVDDDGPFARAYFIDR